MALTALEVKSISCPENQIQTKKSDGNGLFILVKSNGSKLWRFRFKYGGKHQEMAFGKYPTISLRDARLFTEKARVLLMQGINPMDERRERKRAGNTPELEFNVIALKWWEKDKGPWSAEHAIRVKRWITQDCKPISKLGIDQMDASHIYDLMLSIEAAGTPKKAPNILSVIDRVFDYADHNNFLKANPAKANPAKAISLRYIIKPLPKVVHHAAIVKPAQLAKLLIDIDTAEPGSFCTTEALKLIPRIFLRPTEIRQLKWEYINFDECLIHIPKEIMKKERKHLVPMSKQVVSHLKRIKEMTGYSEYVFPNERDSSKCMSKNVMTNRLKLLGYSGDVMCSHGFRATASTRLHEECWLHEAIEIQLAHSIGTSTSQAYNHAKHLSLRKKMMQYWSDYLDELKES